MLYSGFVLERAIIFYVCVLPINSMSDSDETSVVKTHGNITSFWDDGTCRFPRDRLSHIPQRLRVRVVEDISWV